MQIQYSYFDGLIIHIPVGEEDMAYHLLHALLASELFTEEVDNAICDMLDKLQTEHAV